MTQEQVIDKTDTDVSLGKPHNVILFNDEAHDMLEVVLQIQKAIHCGTAQAGAIMLEAHTSGRAIVYTGHLERCEHVAAVLEEIKLGTKIEPV